MELEVTFDSEGARLAGTLSRPAGAAGKLPAMVLVSGSGAHDRDEAVCGHRPFAVIAAHLARR
ncbi:MAG: alpha/beta hydrolase, partial [Kofleriaceae bacterium]